MSNLYFLERTMIERMRDVTRHAEFRTRLGLHTARAECRAGRVRRLLGTWLIRAGRWLQRAEPASRTMARRMLAGIGRGGQCGLS